MRASVGEIEIEYETVGPETGEPIVLIAGVFQQLTFWPESFVQRLVDARLRVVRFDNRDVGRSTWETRPAPDLMAIVSGDLSNVNYTFSDMAADTAGLIEALGYESAHVLGHSMGGGVAERLAIAFPDCVRTLTLVSTSPYDGVTGASSPAFIELVTRSVGDDLDAAVETALDAYRLCIQPEPVDEDALGAYVMIQLGRAPNPGMQCAPASLAATVTGRTSTPTQVEQVAAIAHPTLVVHGTGDLAVAFDGGERLAELIDGARLVTLDGMGHIPLDPRRWATIADAVIAHIRAAQL